MMIFFDDIFSIESKLTSSMIKKLIYFISISNNLKDDTKYATSSKTKQSASEKDIQ